MKKFDIKSVLFGFIIGTVGITTVFAASGIKSATLSNAKVTLDGISVPLSNSLVSITRDDEKDARLYMPVRELLEYIGYDVKWDGKLNTVNLTSPKDLQTPDKLATTIPIPKSNSYLYEGGVAANNFQYGNPFPAKNGDTVTISLTGELSGWQLDKYKITIKIVIGGNDGTTQEVILSNKETKKTIIIKENANHHITIHNTNNQLVNYSFLLTIESTNN